MATKQLALFFFLTALIFSLQTHARESQFFSKVSRNRDVETTTNTNNNYFNSNYNKEQEKSFQETEVPSLNQEEIKEEEPTFLPQTKGTGYGLYGHETALGGENEIPSFNPQNEKNYATELQGLSANGFASEANNNKNSNNNNKEYYNDDDDNINYFKNNGVEKYYEVAGNNGGVERQGMSDTRFLENGKYFYDLNAERNYDPVSYKPYNNRYGNNNNYNGNYNNYEQYNNNGNAMQGYQNQEAAEEEEFDFEP